MYRIKEDSHHEFEIKKSRFICYLHKTFSEEDAKQYIKKIKKEHPNANHHCYAFIIKEQHEIQRSNDDGEPQGSAGVPMLECLAKNQMQDTLAITVRYFGGIKLGTGGLIRAYSKSVSHALQHATRTKKQIMFSYQLSFSYALIGKIDQYFRLHLITIVEKKYEALVCYFFLSEKNLHDDISELTNGKYLPVFIKKEIIDVEAL